MFIVSEMCKFNEMKLRSWFKWNSRRKATKALFAIEYESNLRVMHNCDERGTFKIYRICVFGHIHFEWEC